jgi:hypothetical protein
MAFAVDWRSLEIVPLLLLVAIPLILYLRYLWRGGRTPVSPSQHISTGFGCVVLFAVGVLFAVLGGYGFWPMGGLQKPTLLPWLLKVLGCLVVGWLMGGWIVFVLVMKSRIARQR